MSASTIRGPSMKLTDQQIRALIEDRYIERGRAYMKAGQVELTEITPRRVTAQCAGTRMYTVTLALTGGRLSGACTCPAVEDFGPCKHMAATALTVQATMTGGGYAPSESFRSRKSQVSRIERQLQRMSKAELVALIIEMVPDDEALAYWLSDEIE